MTRGDRLRMMVNELANERGDALICADGQDEAIVGFVELPASSTAVVLYDYDEAIRCLMRDGMDEEEAVEYFDFNVQGAYVGPGGPLYVRRFKLDDEAAPEGGL